MIKNYFKIAMRNLVRHKVSSTINILGLTLGIIACITIFLITRFELSFDNFHPGKERIYRLVSKMQLPSGEKNNLPMVPDPAPATLRAELAGIETITSFHTIRSSVTIKNGKDIQKFYGSTSGNDMPEIILAAPQYFNMFKYEWLAGTPAVLAEPFKVVITESKAHKYFGELPAGKIIGREIVYKDSLHFAVAGIIKDQYENSDLSFKEFLSYATARQHVFSQDEVDLDNWMFWRGSTQAFVKLNKGVNPSAVTAQLTSIIMQHVERNDGTKMSFSLQPLSDMHFSTLYPDDMYQHKAHLPTLYALMGIAAFILIIAAINFINLSTAQSLRRTKEIGIRKVLGSSKKSLVFQFLGETFILTLIALSMAVLLVPAILSAFHSYIPAAVSLNAEPLTIGFLVLICIVTALLAGLYPAKILSSYLPVNSLKGQGFEKTNQKSYLRKGLIVFQFTASLIFIIASLVIGNQVHYVLNKEMGFNKDAVINFSPGWHYSGERAKLFVEKTRSLTGVALASADMGTPANKDHWNTIVQCKDISEDNVEAQMLGGDENYLSLYQLKLVAGRNLQHCDTMKEFLINETLAKRFGFKKPEDAIGKILETGMTDGECEKKCPVVGVVADFHTQSLHEPIKPAFMIQSKQFCNSASIKLNTNGKRLTDFKTTITGIEKIWKEIYPAEKFDYTFFDETIAGFYAKEQRTAGIVNMAMLIAVFISCMGLFGLATFTAQQRKKEIGIRKVLGATVPAIVSLLSKQFLKPVLIALLIASPISWYFMNKWLQDFSYRINISWWIFAAAGLLVILIALFTVSFQAIKAAIANPAKSLRTE